MIKEGVYLDQAGQFWYLEVGTGNMYLYRYYKLYFHDVWYTHIVLTDDDQVYAILNAMEYLGEL